MGTLSKGNKVCDLQNLQHPHPFLPQLIIIIYLITPPRKLFHDVTRAKRAKHASTDKASMFLIDRLPHKSSRGNEHALIACHFDRNKILGRPLLNIQVKKFTKYWKYMQCELTITSAAPSTWVLYNETSHEVQTSITKHTISY